MSSVPEEVALELMDTVPVVMRILREEMRQHRQSSLSVPQFRSLAFVHNRPGASLTNLAEHLGLTPASTSKLVDGLVERELVERRESTEDRRRITLNLTSRGFSLWEETFRRAQASIAVRLSRLSEPQREQLSGAMRYLRPLFEDPPGEAGNDR